MLNNCSSIIVKASIALAISLGICLIAHLLSRRSNVKSKILSNGWLIAVPILCFAFYVLTFARNIPFYDDYDAVLVYLSQSFPERLTHFFDFHNEHRIVTSRIIYECIYGLLGRFDFKICILIGDLILLFYMFILGKKISRQACLLCFLPFLWLFLDLSNYENTLWAMTSVSNQLVLPLALLSFHLFEHRQKTRCHIGSLACAVACTYTTGAGIFVWPVLTVLALKDWLIVDESIKWSKLADWGGMRSTLGRSMLPILCFILVAGISIVCYLNGFHEQSLKLQAEMHCPPQQENVIAAIVKYILSFCGAIVPVQAVALPLGLVVCGLIAFIFINIRKVRGNALLGLLLFTLGSILSGALFRHKFGSAQALQLRYGIVSFSLMASTVALFHGLVAPRFQKAWRNVLCIALFGAVLINVATLILGWDLLKSRTRQLELSVTAPTSQEADPSRPEIECALRSQEKLQNAQEAGVWCPAQIFSTD